MQFLHMITYDSPVVLTFVFLSFAALLLNTLTKGWANRALFSVYRSSAFSLMTYVRMFTHVLGHTNFGHYIGNMMLFLLLGPAVETAYGSEALLIMILITAGVTGLIHMIFFPRVGLCGASGLDFMLITLSSMVSYEQGKIPLSFILVVVLYLGREIYDAVSNKDNISQLTHIIGAALGVVYVLYFNGVIKLPF